MTSEQAKRAAMQYAVCVPKSKDRRGTAIKLCHKMQLLDNRRHGKIMRWFGFIQGVLYHAGCYTVEELKQHSLNASRNRVIFE